MWRSIGRHGFALRSLTFLVRLDWTTRVRSSERTLETQFGRYFVATYWTTRVQSSERTPAGGTQCCRDIVATLTPEKLLQKNVMRILQSCKFSRGKDVEAGMLFP